MAKRSSKEAYGGYGGTADCPGCYGKPVSSTLPECSSCPFYASCQFYLNTTLDDECRYSTRREKWRKHNAVSLDALGDTLETALKIDLDGQAGAEEEGGQDSRRLRPIHRPGKARGRGGGRSPGILIRGIPAFFAGCR